jgi:hypothetical protein
VFFVTLGSAEFKQFSCPSVIFVDTVAAIDHMQWTYCSKMWLLWRKSFKKIKAQICEKLMRWCRCKGSCRSKSSGKCSVIFVSFIYLLEFGNRRDSKPNIQNYWVASQNQVYDCWTNAKSASTPVGQVLESFYEAKPLKITFVAKPFSWVWLYTI